MKRYLFLLAIIFTPIAAQADDARGWTIDAAHSSLNFDSVQSGQTFTGEFKKFGGTIVFDPNHLDQSHVSITVDIASIHVGGEGDQYINAPEWFNTAKFPTAKFEAKSFENAGPQKFIAHGQLTIRDVKLPLDLPFTLVFSPDRKVVIMQGQVVLHRLDYHLGTGSWADAKTVGTDVTARVKVTAN